MIFYMFSRKLYLNKYRKSGKFPLLSCQYDRKNCLLSELSGKQETRYWYDLCRNRPENMRMFEGV